MGYNQPFKKIGKVEPELRNQSKSGLRMNDASPLTQPDDPKKGKKMKDLPLGSKARYEEYRKRGWKQDETSLGEEGADNKIDLRDWQKTGNPEDIQYRMPRK